MAVSSIITMRDKYVQPPRIAEEKFRPLITLFSLGLNAVPISQISPLSSNTVNKYLTAMSLRTAEFCELESPLRGKVGIDVSDFGARRVKGKVSRGESGKTIGFGIFNRNGKV